MCESNVSRLWGRPYWFNSKKGQDLSRREGPQQIEYLPIMPEAVNRYQLDFCGMRYSVDATVSRARSGTQAAAQK
ncbi:hypothetical protein GCM10010525_08900 [Glutamicibacter bergerei]